MPYPKKIKPNRNAPNWNVTQALRLRVNQTNPNPALGEVALAGIGAGNAIPIGTIPGGAVIIQVTRNVEVAFTATTTLDIGTTAGGTDVVASAAIAPQTPARGSVALGTGALAGTADKVIYLSAGTLAPSAGLIDIVVEFYTQKD
jgi:hypothetical protein